MISIIIPTYNEKGVLEDCIQSLGEQTQNDFEIIVIDDGSKDGTLEILKNLKGLCQTLDLLSKVIWEPGQPEMQEPNWQKEIFWFLWTDR